jgi:hypothetical protein
MEYSKFDDFIKSNTKDDLPVPEELSWDNMDFPLPPAKRKRRILPWLLFFLLFTGLTISGIWYIYRQKSNGTGLSRLESIASKEPQNNEVDFESGFPVQHNEQFHKIAPDDISANIKIESPQSIHKVYDTKTIKDDRAQETVALNNAKFQETSKPRHIQSEEIRIDENMVLGSTLESNEIAAEMADIFTPLEDLYSVGEQKSKQFPIAALPMRPLSSDLRIEYISSPSMEYSPGLLLGEQDDITVKQEKKHRYLLLSIGMNTAQLDHSSPILKDAEVSDWGNRYQILFEQEVKNNWLAGVGLAYHRIHSTLTFEKELGTYVNFSEGQIIRQIRHVFHNNYFDFISLNLGVGKQFNLKSRWRTQGSINFSPSYRLMHTGKSITDNETIIDLTPGAIAQNKWIWNAEASWSVSYRLKETVVFCGVNISQTLNKIPLFLNDNNMTIQPRIYSLNLGIKRTL